MESLNFAKGKGSTCIYLFVLFLVSLQFKGKIVLSRHVETGEAPKPTPEEIERIPQPILKKRHPFFGVQQTPCDFSETKEVSENIIESKEVSENIVKPKKSKKRKRE